MPIEPMLSVHWPSVKYIYEAELATGNASFQTSAPTWEEWDKSLLSYTRLVALNEMRLLDGQL